MKSVFSKLFFTISLLTLPTLFAHEVQKLERVSSSDVEFAWDIHDVLVKKHVPSMVKTALVQGGLPLVKMTGSLIFDYTRYAFTGTVGAAQQLINDIKTVVQNGGTGGSIQHVLKEYDPSLAVTAEKISAELYPIDGMPELITELNGLGYTQRIASNIGSQEVKALQAKHGALFEIFNGGKTVTYNNGVPSAKKPDAVYFQEYQDAYNADRTKTIIFIDDNIHNINAAAQEGFMAFHFTNVEKLRNDLKAAGIQLQ